MEGLWIPLPTASRSRLKNRSQSFDQTAGMAIGVSGSRKSPSAIRTIPERISRRSPNLRTRRPRSPPWTITSTTPTKTNSQEVSRAPKPKRAWQNRASVVSIIEKQSITRKKRTISPRNGVSRQTARRSEKPSHEPPRAAAPRRSSGDSDSGRLKNAISRLSAESAAAANGTSRGPRGASGGTTPPSCSRMPPSAGPSTKPRPKAAPTSPIAFERSWGEETSAM